MERRICPIAALRRVYCCRDINTRMFWVSTLTFQGHITL